MTLFEETDEGMKITHSWDKEVKNSDLGIYDMHLDLTEKGKEAARAGNILTYVGEQLGCEKEGFDILQQISRLTSINDVAFLDGFKIGWMLSSGLMKVTLDNSRNAKNCDIHTYVIEKD